MQLLNYLLITSMVVSSTGWTSSRFDRLTTGAGAYSKLCADLITFCVGLVEGVYPNYIRTIPEKQKSAVKKYVHALYSPRANTQEYLQKLLYMLFTQETIAIGERYRTTVYRFLIVYSFREEGNIDWCGTITQHISKLVFFGRCAIYQEIQKRMKECVEGFFLYGIFYFLFSVVHWS